MSKPSVILIGSFDGVHLGHQALARRAMTYTHRPPPQPPAPPTTFPTPPTPPTPTPPSPLRTLALVLDPHPASVLKPDRVPGRLTSFEQRSELLNDLGIDEIIKLSPTPDLLSQTPEMFVRWLVDEYAMSCIVEGTDFHFGANRAGNINTLKQLGNDMGFDVSVVTPVEIAQDDQLIVRASSTHTRRLIRQGRMVDVNLMLGRPYQIISTVQRGDRRGRSIGFPTANLLTDNLLPADGVYAGWATLPDGSNSRAAINVGKRPTFDAVTHVVEAHLLDVDLASDGVRIDGLQEYGWPIALNFTHWVRDQIRFASALSLTHQLKRDLARVTILLAQSPTVMPGIAAEASPIPL